MIKKTSLTMTEFELSVVNTLPSFMVHKLSPTSQPQSP